MSNESSDFKVQDRRKFNEAGDLRDDSNESEPPKVKSSARLACKNEGEQRLL